MEFTSKCHGNFDNHKEFVVYITKDMVVETFIDGKKIPSSKYLSVRGCKYRINCFGDYVVYQIDNFSCCGNFPSEQITQINKIKNSYQNKKQAQWKIERKQKWTHRF